MAYESRHPGRQRVLYNNANTTNPIKYQLILDGKKVTPTSGAITIYAPGSTTALVSAGVMTVTGSVLTYALSTTTTASYPIGTGYRADVVVTYGAATYARQLQFDVVKYLFDLNIGIDQLRAFDDSIQGMQHVDDETFSQLIQACMSQLQAKIEAKVIEDKKLLTNMILDTAIIGTAAINYILSRIHFNKGDTDRFNNFDKAFDDLWPAVLSSIKYDVDQDGFEGSKIGGITECRLET
jgi:hypothetical protein